MNGVEHEKSSSLLPRAKCDVAKQRRAHYRSRSKSQRTYAIIYYLRLSTISSFWQHKKRVVHCTVSQLWLTSRLHSFQTTLDISEQQQKSCRTSCLCVSLLKWVKRTSHWRVFFFCVQLILLREFMRRNPVSSINPLRVCHTGKTTRTQHLSPIRKK